MLVLTAIFALGLVIVFHEAGHYLFAVWSGMKVDRFSVFGIGPAILRLGTWRGTEFVIGAIPFGAYVQIRGMEAAESETPAVAPDSFSFRDKPIGARAMVLVGGPLANYVVAILLYFGVFLGFGVAPNVIVGFADESPAQAAGLEVGDMFVQVGSTSLEPHAGVHKLIEASEGYRGQVMPVVVEREGETVDAKIDVPTEGLALGVSFGAAGEREPLGLGDAVTMAVVTPIQMSVTNLQMLYFLVTGQVSGQMQGPVGIVQQMAQSARQSGAKFLEMTALISTLLGMFNLLPLPALDGGRLTFLGLEAIRRRRIRPHIEDLIHGYGMLALLALMLFATVGDVRNLF